MDRQGVSLVEVIVAALILSITLGGLLFIFTNEKAVIARTGRRVEAMEFARQRLEELKRVDWETAEMAQTDGDWSGGQGDWTDWTEVTGGLAAGFEGEGRRYRVQDVDVDNDGEIDYKRVEIMVNWSEPTE